MKSLLSILALFSIAYASAQPGPASYGRELPRGGLIGYASAAEATEGAWTDSRYLKPLTRWERQDNRFTTSFTVPFDWANRSVLLCVASATADYEVRLNGKTVAYNADPSLPAEFDLTRSVREGLNTLEIALNDPSPVAALESWEHDAPAVLGRTHVMSQPMMRIRDVFVRTQLNGQEASAEIGIVVKTGALNPKTSRIHYELLTPSNEVAAIGHQDVTLDMRREDTVRFIASIPRHLLWEPETPTRYTLRLKTQYEGRYLEYIELHPGFCAVALNDGQPTINGRPAQLKKRDVVPWLTGNDMAALKELGYNTLRPQADLVPDSFYALCDEMGFFAIAQAPIDTRKSGESRRKGANPTNDPAWLPAFIERTQDSYHTAKRHPSVIAFSLAEESSNGINLYESYLNLKRMEHDRPIVNPDAAGEWNTDRFEYEP